MRITPCNTITFGKNKELSYPKPYFQIIGNDAAILYAPFGGDEFIGHNIEADGKKMYTIDTLIGRVQAYALDPDKDKKIELKGENSSETVYFDRDKAIRNSILAHKRICAHPPLRIIKKGTAKGKVVFYQNDEQLKKVINYNTLDEPIIAVVAPHKNAAKYFYSADYGGHSLVKGLVFANRDESVLCHDSTQMRNTTETAAMTYDTKAINQLRKLEGKYIELEISREGMKFREISPDEIDNRTKEKQKVKIRPMSSEAKILKPDEINLDNAGPKAVNLAKMLGMQKDGKLKNVKIPPFFVIPTGIFDSIKAVNPEKMKEFNELAKQFENNLPNDEALKLSKKIKHPLYYMFNPLKFKEMPPEAQTHYTAVKAEIDKHTKEILDDPEDMLVVRSAFNGEDTESYSAAGLYSSRGYISPFEKYSSGDVMYWAEDTLNSQYQLKAYLSRKANGIPEDAIKPCVVVQKQIKPDYAFTVYTDDVIDPDSLFIELRSTCHRIDPDFLTSDPNIIKYNKKTGKLSLVAKERFERPVITDTEGNVVIASPQDSEIVDNFKQWEKTLKELAESCLEVAEEFGAPQDIEGGIDVEKLKNGKKKHQIYMWQTRNIVQ